MAFCIKDVDCTDLFVSWIFLGSTRSTDIPNDIIVRHKNLFRGWNVISVAKAPSLFVVEFQHPRTKVIEKAYVRFGYDIDKYVSAVCREDQQRFFRTVFGNLLL